MSHWDELRQAIGAWSLTRPNRPVPRKVEDALVLSSTIAAGPVLGGAFIDATNVLALLTSQKEIPDIVGWPIEPPADNSVVYLGASGGTSAYIAFNRRDGVLRVSVIGFRRSVGAATAVGFGVIGLDDGCLADAKVAVVKDDLSDVVTAPLTVSLGVWTALTAFAMMHAGLCESREVVRSAKLGAMFAKRGRNPAKYHEVVIKQKFLEEEAMESLATHGGDPVRRRMHLVRKHLWTKPDGETAWRGPYWRGDPSLGFLWPRYRVQP